jgi:hypothetical protein
MSRAIVVGALLAMAAQAGGADLPDPGMLAKVELSAPEKLAPGQDGTLALTIVPTGTKEAPTHLETAFPVKATLTASPGVTIGKDKLAKTDATQLERKAIRFEVPLKLAAAGDHEIRAKVKFAVCIEDPRTAETKVCLPQDREVVYQVKAK